MDFQRHSQEVARRFLQTVVIVDDEAYIRPPIKPSEVKTPGRDIQVHVAKDEAEHAEPSNHSLDAGLLSESFTKYGLICAVVPPVLDLDNNEETETINALVSSLKRTDIVILDWRLGDDNGKRTLSMLGHILKDDDKERLRLIAIYTGESDLSYIGGIVLKELDGFEGDNHNVVLSRRHCRIVIYAKSNTSLIKEIEGRSVSESDLPQKLIEDFAKMIGGLLPNIALTALAVIRENAHRILDRFDGELDPAFLTHRAYLPSPNDAQQNMIDQIANELHSVINDGVMDADPAGMDAIKKWLEFSFRTSDFPLSIGEGTTMSRCETIALLEHGIEKAKPNHWSKNKAAKALQFLTSAFSNHKHLDHQLDHHFAWMFNFRSVFNSPSPTLRLGSVLRRSDDGQFFLCMRPRCDSVRLHQQLTIFLLLPLIENPDRQLIQIVLKDEDTYKRVGICMEMNRWLLEKFLPEQDAIVAEKRSNGSANFYFTNTKDVRFDWLGEIKMEFAQHIAHEFASYLSRVAVTDSEWLRRTAK